MWQAPPRCILFWIRGPPTSTPRRWSVGAAKCQRQWRSKTSSIDRRRGVRGLQPNPMARVQPIYILFWIWATRPHRRSVLRDRDRDDQGTTLHSQAQAGTHEAPPQTVNVRGTQRTPRQRGRPGSKAKGMSGLGAVSGRVAGGIRYRLTKSVNQYLCCKGTPRAREPMKPAGARPEEPSEE